MIRRILLVAVFLAGLWYLIYPGPSSISNFTLLPDSLKSDEPGDTIQNPNIAAYFSDSRRKFVTNYYKDSFSYLKIFGLTIPPIRLNHPPERAFDYIRDQQRSTYLEEYVYPLRDSLFVNGYEPFNEDGKPFDKVSLAIFIGDRYYQTKTTIRFYPSSPYVRVVVYSTLWLTAIFLYKLLVGVVRKNEAPV